MSNLPGNTQRNVAVCGRITGAFQCPWAEGCKETPPLLHPGTVGGSSWRNMYLGGAIFPGGKPAHTLGLCREEEGLSKEPGVPVDTGVTLALLGRVGAQWEQPGQGCPSLLLLGHNSLDCACHGDPRILPALLRGSGEWLGLAVFAWCHCLCRLVQGHPHTHSLASLHL